MIRRLAPRRLGTDEEATVVEHLSELRHRLLIAIAAIIPAFLLTFAFHTQLIEWLMRPLPEDKTLVTLGVTEPFTTAVKVSGLAAIAIVLPILIWQVWGFLAPAVDHATQRILRVFIVIATALFAAGVIFAYFVVLPAALTFLTNFDVTLYDVQIRASYYLSFTSLVLIASGPRVRDADLHPRPRSHPGAELRQAAAQPQDRLRADGLPSRSCCPTVDPVSLLFEVIPLLILFEASIWLSKIMEKRWGFADDADEDLADADDDDDRRRGGRGGRRRRHDGRRRRLGGG